MDELDFFWQARVRITQAPHPFEPEFEPVIPEKGDFFKEPTYLRSFLYNSFGTDPIRPCGLELSAYEKIDWTFFTRAEDEQEATKLGHEWLANLQFHFLGLDGEVEARDSLQLFDEGWRGSVLEELVFPVGSIVNELNIIERFVKLFYFKKKFRVRLLFLWKERERERKGAWGLPNYTLRVFFNYHMSDLSEVDQLTLQGLVNSLFRDLRSIGGESVSKRVPKDCSLWDVVSCNVFNGALDSRCCFIVHKDNMAFDFPENLPLPRMSIIQDENVRYIDLDKEFFEGVIRVGSHVKDGVITHRTTYAPIDKFPQDMVVFGKSGSGKTRMLAFLLEELCKKAESVGILILNVAKESQEIYYKNFKTVKYSDEEFKIPYFLYGDNESLQKRLQETASYICASLGLKNVFEKIIYRTQIGFTNLKGRLPERFYALLKGVERYMESNPYGREEQSNLLQAFRNRMNVFDEDKIQHVLKITEEIPHWMKEWMEGGKIFLDLSMCSKYIRLLVVNAIFQLVRILTKDNEAEELKHLIVIDEAHAILEKPITTNSDDADFIMKEMMEKIFSELLKEYRSRGVGFILADQSPSKLFNDVASQPSIKVLFRLDHPNNLLFSENPDERQMMTQLPNRIALVVNGTTGEKYLIKTLDFK